MITVSILINGKPIFTRSATRQEDYVFEIDQNTYKVDTGEIIKHNYKDGVVVLAKKLLDTIKEEK